MQWFWFNVLCKWFSNEGKSESKAKTNFWLAANNLFRFDNVHLKNTVETTTVESLSQDSTIFQMSGREPIFTSCNTLRCWGSTGAPLSEVRPPKKFLPDLCLFTFTISCTHFFCRTRFKLPALPLARPKKKKKENTAPGKWDLLSFLL